MRLLAFRKRLIYVYMGKGENSPFMIRYRAIGYLEKQEKSV